MLCDFTGYKNPEIVKRRPVVIVSPQGVHRTTLCTIVPLSTTPPDPIMPYHYLLENLEQLNDHFNSSKAWAKCDLIYTVSYERLSLFFKGKDDNGKRIYRYPSVTEEQLRQIRLCIMKSLGFTNLLVP